MDNIHMFFTRNVAENFDEKKQKLETGFLLELISALDNKNEYIRNSLSDISDKVAQFDRKMGAILMDIQSSIQVEFVPIDKKRYMAYILFDVPENGIKQTYACITFVDSKKEAESFVETTHPGHDPITRIEIYEMPKNIIAPAQKQSKKKTKQENLQQFIHTVNLIEKEWAKTPTEKNAMQRIASRLLAYQKEI